MKYYYKLTDQNMQTKDGFQWELNKQYEIDKNLQGETIPLCTAAWFHVYTHPLLAAFLNPAHANIKTPRLFKCKCSGLHSAGYGKKGFTIIKLMSEVELPEITLEQRIIFSLLCIEKTFGHNLCEKLMVKDYLDTNKNIKNLTQNFLYLAFTYTFYSLSCDQLIKIAKKAIKN